jgi:hypothetical protein
LNCEKCHELFPNTFYDADLFAASPLRVHSDKVWWALIQDGYLFGNTTKFKASFTLAYETLEEAQNIMNKPHHDSEWSLRIYSLNDGYGPWDEYVLASLGHFYKSLLTHYGSIDYTCA